MKTRGGRVYGDDDTIVQPKSVKRPRIERFAKNTHESRSSSRPRITAIPVELLLEIFSYLTANDLFPLRKVCKLFDNVLKVSSIWRIYEVTGREATSSHVIGELKRMPLLKKFTIKDRPDSDEILRQLSVSNKSLEELCIFNCTGSTAKLYLKSRHLTRILERCRRLHTINIQGTRFRGVKFYKLLASMGMRLRTVYARATSLQFRTFADHARHISERGRRAMTFMCFGRQGWVPLYYSTKKCSGATSVVVCYSELEEDFTSVDVVPDDNVVKER